MRTIHTALPAFLALFVLAAPARAQVTPAAGYTPPDDTPSIKVGVTLFTDYTYQVTPEVTDADGNAVEPERVQRRARVHQRDRQHLAPARVSHHARHHARNGRGQLAERQPHVPPEVRLRAAQPR